MNFGLRSFALAAVDRRQRRVARIVVVRGETMSQFLRASLGALSNRSLGHVGRQNAGIAIAARLIGTPRAASLPVVTCNSSPFANCPRSVSRQSFTAKTPGPRRIGNGGSFRPGTSRENRVRVIRSARTGSGRDVSRGPGLCAQRGKRLISADVGRPWGRPLLVALLGGGDHKGRP